MPPQSNIQLHTQCQFSISQICFLWQFSQFTTELFKRANISYCSEQGTLHSMSGIHHSTKLQEFQMKNTRPSSTGTLLPLLGLPPLMRSLPENMRPYLTWQYQDHYKPWFKQDWIYKPIKKQLSTDCALWLVRKPWLLSKGGFIHHMLLSPSQ